MCIQPRSQVYYKRNTQINIQYLESASQLQIMSTSDQAKQAATAAIDAKQGELDGVSSYIFKNPELYFQETKAHQRLTDYLEQNGFTVERGYKRIATAFRATWGTSGPNVGFLCEYDCVDEDVLHACGHNLIAEAGIAAGIGLKAALMQYPSIKGRVTIYGTPAEEGGGGKVYLLNRGAFANDVDFAMMVHPCSFTAIAPQITTLMMLDITFIGKAAHASAFPWEGINALDAAVVFYDSISCLRQQLKPGWGVRGVITNGGSKPNVIPNKTALLYQMQTQVSEELHELYLKVVDCIEGAARATGCTCEYQQPKGERTYTGLLKNDPLATEFQKNLIALGYDPESCPMDGELGTCTDMGNVSYIVPGIHPIYKIGTGNEVNHTMEFKGISDIPASHDETINYAKALAHTAIGVLTTDGLLSKIKLTFRNNIKDASPEVMALVHGFPKDQ